MSSSILSSFLHPRIARYFFPSNCYKQIRRKHSQLKYLYNMNEAYLRYKDGDETFVFTFRYANPDLNVDRQFNMMRRPVESVSNFLKRIDANLDKVLAKKRKKKSKKNPISPEELKTEDNVESGNIALMRNDAKINLDSTCETLFRDTSQLKLRIFDNTYMIRMNVPWITEMGLSASILSGFPTYPTVFEAVYTDKDKSTFAWYKNCSKASPQSAAYEAAWEEVGQGYMYTPTSADVESRLKLRCVPANDEKSGPAMEAQSTGFVEAGPGELPCEIRHSFTKNRLSGENFRVTSYNILADIYASTEQARDVLFCYCPAYALDIDYRKQLIVKELLGYNSDIICLQEVDSKIFETDLRSVLSTLHYGGVFTRKGGELSEGIATFYDERRFEKISTEFNVMRQNVDVPGFAEVWQKISNETVKERFLGRNTTVQATVLRSKDDPSKILVVGNTHLYFRPDADHIRLLQGFYILNYCREIARRTSETLNNETGTKVSIVICGDFNSSPDCGIYQLMTSNHVPEDHKDWSSNADQIVENVSLTNDMSFGSACGTPEYTNFTVEFADCLDYIYYQTDSFEVTQVVPFPSKEELTLHAAIPSPLFPSDHIALCADLKWKIQ